MRYRKLDEDGDYTFGHGLADFHIDVPEAVAQAVLTRMWMQTGEWFLDVTDGTPWRISILGKYTDNTRDQALRYRALGTPGVNGMTDYRSALDTDTRKYTVTATLGTVYGEAPLTAENL